MQYVDESMCKSKLGKRLQAFRADRPSEWMMDEFIHDAEEMAEMLLSVIYTNEFGGDKESTELFEYIRSKL